MVGRVVSTKNKNSATVLVSRTVMDPLYKKTFIRSKRYLVGDSEGVKEGDLVEILNCRPISGRKNWQIVKVLGKSLAEITEEKLKVAAEKAISEVMPEEPENSEKLGEPKNKQSLPSADAERQSVRKSENSDIRSSETASIPSPSDAVKKRKSKNKKEGK